MSVTCFRDGSDAPLHVLSVEFVLCFGHVVGELLDGLGIVCALLVGDVLAKKFRTKLIYRRLHSFVRNVVHGYHSRKRVTIR